MEIWKQKFRNLKLSKKMFLVFVMILSIISIISITAMQISLGIYDSRLYEKSLQELNYFTRTVKRQLDELEQVSYNICMDYDIQKQLDAVQGTENQQEYLLGITNFRSRLLSASFSGEYVMDIIYTDRKQMQVHAGKSYQKLPGSIYQEVVQKASEARGAYVFAQPTLSFPYLVSSRDILEHIDYSLRNLGTLILISDFDQIIESNRKNLGNEDSRLYILAEEGAVYASEQTFLQKPMEFAGVRGYRVINMDSEKYFLCYQKSEKLGWTFVNMFPYTDIFYMNVMVRNLMLGGIILSFLMASICMRKVAGIMTAPLERLTRSMEIVQEGKFEEARNCLDTEQSEDEIGALQEDFRVMLERMEFLIHENYEKQILLKDTQYKALQAQINPHFLYNTLNSVNWMIRRGRPEEASGMVNALGRLFRVAFSKETMGTIKAEMQLLRDYTAIQDVRYGTRMVFEAEQQPDTDDFTVPKIILQPLVENAIMYGVENSLNICHIKVQVQLVQEKLYLTVEDDGPGMEEQELIQVRTFTMQPKGNGIGLKNMKERLQLVFGTDFTFDIQSSPGQGTKVSIAVPARRRDPHV